MTLPIMGGFDDEGMAVSRKYTPYTHIFQRITLDT
jgi:hypothetical protein